MSKRKRRRSTRFLHTDLLGACAPRVAFDSRYIPTRKGGLVKLDKRGYMRLCKTRDYKQAFGVLVDRPCAASMAAWARGMRYDTPGANYPLDSYGSRVAIDGLPFVIVGPSTVIPVDNIPAHERDKRCPTCGHPTALSSCNGSGRP